MSRRQPENSAQPAVKIEAIKKRRAALPQHSAERLCLSDRFRFSDCEAAPRIDARGIASNSEIRHAGKAEPFRTVLRQSRQLLDDLQLNIYDFSCFQTS